MEQRQRNYFHSPSNSLKFSSLTKKITSYEIKTKIIGKHDAPTLRLFGALQGAFNFFHEALFNSRLTSVILTLNKKSGCLGYYKPLGWYDESQKNIPEININPVSLYRKPIDVMSTLVHEMCHHHQYLFGNPGYGRYHNREFAKIMFNIGLICSNTGKLGGKQTGMRMSHYINPDGLFAKKFREMPEEFILPFKPLENQHQQLTGGDVNNNTRNKMKYSCPKCEANIWGKPEMNIICGICNKSFKQVTK